VSFLFPASTITFDAAIRDLARGNPKSRAAAAHALGDVVEPTEKRRAVEALIAALEDDRHEVRAEACSSLGDLGELAAVPGLVKRLDDGSPPVRQNAAIALGSLRAADGFEALALALREGPADLRFQAATSIGEIDGRRAFDPLLAALADKDPQVVSAAALALGTIPVTLEDTDLKMRARTALLEHLDDLDAAARFDVAYALAELDDAAGKSVLTGALADPERAWDAVSALAKLGDRDALIRTLTNDRVPPEATVLAAGWVLRLGKAGEPEHEPAKRVLLAAFTARKTHVRGLAVEQVTEVGGSWAVAPLEAMAKVGKNGEILDVIAAALQAIADRGRRSAERSDVPK
jgi:HEAT repeat protein